MKSRTITKLTPLLICGLIATGFAGSAQAQAAGPAQNLLDSKFSGSIGGFVMQSDVSAQLNGQSSTNPEINFNDTFGTGSSATRIRADALWRITPTQHLRFMWFDNSNENSRVLANPVKWGDYTFNAGSNVTAKSKFAITELAYEYAFMRRPSYELAGTLGVHYTDISLELSGAASITDANGVVTVLPVASKAGSLPMPLPVIGLRGGWVVAPNWYVDAQGQFFKAKVGDYDASVTEFRLGATYMFTPNYGLGLGYNNFRTNVDVTKSDYSGTAKFGYSGLQLYLTGAF